MQESSGLWLKNKKEEDTDEVQKIKKQIGFNLNILTPDNYEKLKDKITNLALSSNVVMETFITMILEKAWEDKLYVGLYAQLCFYIYEKQKENKEQDKKDNKEIDKKDYKFFKNQLLANIQKVFEHQKVMKEEIDEEDVEGNTELLRRRKRRVLGNIKFIGELYLVKLLPVQIINYVCGKLTINFLKEYYMFHVHGQ